MPESFSETYGYRPDRAYDFLGAENQKIVDSLLERCVEGEKIKPIVLEVLSDHHYEVSDEELNELVNLIDKTFSLAGTFALTEDGDGQMKKVKRISRPGPADIVAIFFTEKEEKEFRQLAERDPQVAYRMLRARIDASKAELQDPEKVAEGFRDIAKFVLRMEYLLNRLHKEKTASSA